MSNLKDDIRKLKKEIMLCKDCMTNILSLPSLNEVIEKAEAYDEEKSLYESEKQLYKEARADAEKSKEKYDKLFKELIDAIELPIKEKSPYILIDIGKVVGLWQAYNDLPAETKKAIKRIPEGSK